jgi:hypothetical protein
LILLLVTGCASPPPQVKVADILANCESYKGKSVQAMGYLGQCTFEGCFLAANKARWGAFQRAWANYQELSRKVELYDDARKAGERVKRLSPLGFRPKDEAGDAFIREAEPLQERYVIVTGTISGDGCTGWDDAGHTYGIKPTDISAWTPSDSAPANTH